MSDSYAPIPAEPGWTIVTGWFGSSTSKGDPFTPDWTVDIGDLEIEVLPIVAWSLTGTAMPYVVRDYHGKVPPDSPLVECIDKELFSDSGYFLVGIFHPTHRPAPSDSLHRARQIASELVLMGDQLEWRISERAAMMAGSD